MRIAIDARMLTHPQPGGFKSYTTNLIHHLARRDDEHDYTLFTDRPADGGEAPIGPRITCEVVPPGRGWAGVAVREQRRVPRRLRDIRPALAHFPCGTAPATAACPIVVTVHDAIEFVERRPLRPWSRETVRRALMASYTRWAQRRAVRRCAAVITDSLHARADLVRVHGIDRERIHVIPIAASERFRPLADEQKLAELRARLALPDRFALAFGSASPRKNVAGLLRAYRGLPGDLSRAVPLVIVWAHHYLANGVESDVRRLGLDGAVRFVHRVPDDDLVLLYNAADAFVFPSLYEGFGLPVLEAMACGTPTIAGNLTAVPEVAGDAAELVDPRDPFALAGAIEAVLRSPRRREALSRAGLRRAAEFSWQRTAEATVRVYRMVAG